MKRWDVMSARPKKDGGNWWTRVGSAFEGQKGINVVFDSLPLPDAEGRVSVSLFEPRQNDNGGQQRGGGGQARQQSNSRSGHGGGWDELDDGTAPF